MITDSLSFSFQSKNLDFKLCKWSHILFGLAVQKTRNEDVDLFISPPSTQLVHLLTPFQVSRRLSTVQNLLQLLTQKAWTLRLACARKNKVISKLTGFSPLPPSPSLCFVIFLMHESSDFCSPAWKRLYLPSPPLRPSLFPLRVCLLVSHLRRGYLQPHNSRQINSFDVAQSHISSPPSLTGNRFRHGNQDAFTSAPLIDT